MDGHSLKYELDHSVDLIHAHGVFVYLSFLNSIEYLIEMARVCKKGGYIVFDFYAKDSMSGHFLSDWLGSRERYPIILSGAYVQNFFTERGFRKEQEFQNKYGRSFSTYHIYQKNR